MNTQRLKTFIQDFTRLADAHHGNEAAMLANGKLLVAALVAQDDWLPPAYAAPNPDRYTQYLLHCDPLERFSVVSFVWGPGQKTPVHDHTVWGLVGVLRGAETETHFTRAADGRLLPGDRGPMAQFMYENPQGTRLTLYVTKPAADDRESAFRFAKEAGVGVFYWVDPRFAYALAGDLEREALLAIAETAYRQLERAGAGL